MLAESHISVHTWPELSAATVDIYVCGATADPRAAVQRLLDVLRPTESRVAEVRRGRREPFFLQELRLEPSAQQ